MTKEQIAYEEKHGFKVSKIHELGDIQITEFLDEKENRIVYRPYIRQVRCPFLFSDIEQAIVGAIAIKYDGNHTRADEYFWKMIK